MPKRYTHKLGTPPPYLPGRKALRNYCRQVRRYCERSLKERGVDVRVQFENGSTIMGRCTVNPEGHGWRFALLPAGPLVHGYDVDLEIDGIKYPSVFDLVKVKESPEFLDDTVFISEDVPQLGDHHMEGTFAGFLRHGC